MWIAAGVGALVAAALRWRGIFTDFWLDEIWSYDQFARRAHSVADILFNPAFKHDNNQSDRGSSTDCQPSPPAC
jgi:hypothetical protein